MPVKRTGATDPPIRRERERPLEQRDGVLGYVVETSPNHRAHCPFRLARDAPMIASTRTGRHAPSIDRVACPSGLTSHATWVLSMAPRIAEHMPAASLRVGVDLVRSRHARSLTLALRRMRRPP